MITIVHAIDRQLRTIVLCAARDVQIKNSMSPLGVLSSLIEPLLLILMITAAFTLVRLRVPAVGDYIMLLLTTGVLVLAPFRGCAMAGDRALRSMRRILVFPQVRILDLLAAGALSEVLATVALFLCITLFFAVVYQAGVPENLLLSVLPFFCNAVMGFGMGCINLVIKSWFSFWVKIFAIITGPLNLVSGMFYTAEQLPYNIQKIIYYNPFMHATELCRTAYFPEYRSDFFDPYYYGGWVVGLLVIGLLCERVFRHRLLSDK